MKRVNIKRLCDHILFFGSKRVISLLRVWLGLEIIQERHVEIGNDNFVIVANHQSMLDIIALVCAFPHQNLRFVGKKELRRWIPTISRLLRFQQHALIRRSRDIRNTMKSIKNMALRLRNFDCPVIFPEGTRSKTGDLGTFHAAGLRWTLAIRNLPIICVAIETQYLTNQRAIHHMKRHRLKILRRISAPQSKNECDLAIKEVRDLISQQLYHWRSTD